MFNGDFGQPPEGSAGRAQATSTCNMSDPPSAAAAPLWGGFSMSPFADCAPHAPSASCPSKDSVGTIGSTADAAGRGQPTPWLTAPPGAATHGSDPRSTPAGSQDAHDPATHQGSTTSATPPQSTATATGDVSWPLSPHITINKDTPKASMESTPHDFKSGAAPSQGMKNVAPLLPPSSLPQHATPATVPQYHHSGIDMNAEQDEHIPLVSAYDIFQHSREPRYEDITRAPAQFKYDQVRLPDGRGLENVEGFLGCLPISALGRDGATGGENFDDDMEDRPHRRSPYAVFLGSVTARYAASTVSRLLHAVTGVKPLRCHRWRPKGRMQVWSAYYSSQEEYDNALTFDQCVVTGDECAWVFRRDARPNLLSWLEERRRLVESAVPRSEGEPVRYGNAAVTIAPLKSSTAKLPRNHLKHSSDVQGRDGVPLNVDAAEYRPDLGHDPNGKRANRKSRPAVDPRRSQAQQAPQHLPQQQFMMVPVPQGNQPMYLMPTAGFDGSGAGFGQPMYVMANNAMPMMMPGAVMVPGVGSAPHSYST